MGAVPDLEIPDVSGALRDLVFQVPAGRVTTYRALAEALGDPEAGRFLATFLASEEARGWPVHRVVHASGAVARPFGQEENQAAETLRAEGVRVVGNRVDPLLRYFFADFRTQRPLARLQEEQREVARHVVLGPVAPPEKIGALDIAYRGEEAIVAYVFANARGEPVEFLLSRSTTRFPYIRTYLSYRELPPSLAALAEAREKGWWPDVLLLDGNGILHPRRAGIATHLGVLLDLPTVGVAKSHLCGDVNTEGMEVGEWRPVLLAGEVVAGAIRTGRNRTLFVSPGHHADVESSVELILALTQKDELPSPLRWAHELATEAARG